MTSRLIKINEFLRPYTKRVYYHKLNSTLWLSHVQSILNKIGLSYTFDEVNMLDPSHIIISELKGRLTDQYLHEELCNVSKMRTYKSYKSELVMESYLLLPSHLQTALLRFRISCHQLRSETGRYLRPPLPAQERICNDGSIEDEKHFMLSCTLYSNMLAYIVFLDTCKQKIHHFKHLSTESKFYHAMRSTDHKLICLLANLGFKYRAMHS